LAGLGHLHRSKYQSDHGRTEIYRAAAIATTRIASRRFDQAPYFAPCIINADAAILGVGLVLQSPELVGVGEVFALTEQVGDDVALVGVEREQGGLRRNLAPAEQLRAKGQTLT